MDTNITEAPSKIDEKNKERNTSLVFRAAILYAFMFGLGELNFVLLGGQLNISLNFYAALVWIPALLGPLAQIVAANMVDKYKCRVKLCYWPVYIQVASLLPLAFISFWPSTIDNIYPNNYVRLSHVVFISCIFLYFMGGNFAVPPWQSFLGDLIPNEKLSKFFAKILAVNSAFILGTQLILGFILYNISKKSENQVQAFALVYGICFLISFVARTISGYSIQIMKDIPYEINNESKFTFYQFIRRAKESNFVKFTLFVAFISMAINVSAPYYFEFWKSYLKYTDAQWVALTSVGTLASILTFVYWGRFTDHFGNKKTIQYCSIFLSFAPLGWFISINFYYLLILQALTLVFFTGFTLSTLNYIYEAASATKRARCFAYYGLLIGIGTYLGTQIGLIVSKNCPESLFQIQIASPFYLVLIATTILRFVSCFLLLNAFKELREVKPFQMSILWDQVLQAPSLLKNPFQK